MAELIPQMIFFGLINPVIALPAFLFGCIVRRWWLVPVGAVAIAAVLLVLNLLNFAAPPDSEIVWPAIPVTALSPLVWCAAGFYFGRWRRQRRGGSAMPAAARLAAILAGLVLGAAAGALAGFGIGQAYVMPAHVSSFEGLAGYVAVFLFALPGLVIGAIVGAAIGAAFNTRLQARRTSAA